MRWRRFALVSILLAGALLRIWQFTGNVSLWIDEIAVAENVLRHSLRALLFLPLDFSQVAPPGFLLMVKGTATLFGPSDLALRVFPLSCALISLGLFARVAKEALCGWTALFATALFSLGVPFIDYGAEVKQYSSDIAVSLLLTLLAFDLHRNRTGPRFLRAGILGAVAVWLSQTAVLMLAGLGLGLILLARQDKAYASWRKLLGLVTVWAGFALAAVATAEQKITPLMRPYLDRFWRQGFPPLPRSTKEALWLPKTLLDFWWQESLRYPLPELYLILMLLGLYALWKHRRQAAILLFAPVAVTLLASAARQYPFAGRLILFLASSFLLASAEGAALVAGWLSRVRVSPAVTFSLLALPPVLALARDPPVYRHEDTKPMIAYVAARRQPGDTVYVYYGAERAFRYCAPRFGLDPKDAYFGRCHRGDPRAYLSELDRFRGLPRVWVLFAHSGKLGEQPTILVYLHRIGIRRDGFAVSKRALLGVRAELYDLSIPERLAVASAKTYPVPRQGAAGGDHFECEFGPLTPGPASTR